MRRRTYVFVSTLALACMLSIGARAQGVQATAQTTVTVRIPTVLRLSIENGTTRDSRRVGFTADGTGLHPDNLQIDVFANSSWTLTVDDLGGDGPDLQYLVEPQAGLSTPSGWATPTARQVVASGGATKRWLPLRLRFQVDPGQLGQHGKRTLMFTLTHP